MQWRLSFSGLTRETFLNLVSGTQKISAHSPSFDDTFSWARRESSTPLELIFDLNRISDDVGFAFEVSSEGSAVINWKLDALNSEESMSPGSFEVKAGDSGNLLEFSRQDDGWTLVAKAPAGSSRSQVQNPRQDALRPRLVKLLVDASPSASAKLSSPTVIDLITELNELTTVEFGSSLVISYLGQFETAISKDQMVENQHASAIARVLQQESRPDPLRKVVLRMVEESGRGGRIVILSDNTFLVSAELAQLAESKDVKVDILIVGNPAVISEIRDSTHFNLRLLSDRETLDALKEICFFGLG